MNLLENPFHLLGATPRDSRRRIVELADERALFVDPENCAKARADLTNPRTRVAAEVAWLPGVADETSRAVLNAVSAAAGMPTTSGLQPLAAANVAASALALAKSAMPVGRTAELIVALAQATDATRAENVVEILNEDRIHAGMPEIFEEALVEEAISEQRRFYVGAIRAALDRMPSHQLVDAVLSIVDRTTDRGQKHAPLLIDQFVDVYEVEAARFLEIEGEAVSKLVNAIREAATRRVQRQVVEKLIERLDEVLRNWDTVAQPIQLSARARGIDHVASSRLANEVRGLAVDLFNEHGMLWAARRMTSMLVQVFAEVPRLVEILDKDIATLERMDGPPNAALLAELMRQGKLR